MPVLTRHSRRYQTPYGTLAIRRAPTTPDEWHVLLDGNVVGTLEPYGMARTIWVNKKGRESPKGFRSLKGAAEDLVSKVVGHD